jgi:type IV secretory pathway TraG/TraD family ATPase VirD4
MREALRIIFIVLLIGSGVILLFTLSMIFLSGYNQFLPEAYILGAFVVLMIVLTIFTKKKKVVPVEEQNQMKLEPNEMEQEYGFELLLPSQVSCYMISNPFRGTLITGSAGSGKSVSVVRWIMKASVRKGYSGLLYDFKSPELTNDMYAWFNQEPGQVKIHRIDFGNPSHSERCNPLDVRFIQSVSYAREYATAIINNLLPESIDKPDFWTRSATDLLTAVIWFLRTEFPEFSTLPHAVKLILSDEVKLINLLRKNTQCAGLVQSVASAIDNEARDQIAGVIGTLQSAMAKIYTEEICYLLSGNDFDLNVNDPENPKFVCVGTNPTLVDTFSPVISLIFTVATKQMNQPNKHHSVIILDEAPTVYIPKFDLIPATGRSNKIATVFACQDISQIVDGYGDKKADVILSNLNNQIFGRASGKKGAHYVSDLFGKEDTTYMQRSTGENTSRNSSITGGGSSRGTNEGYSESIQERYWIKPQEMLDLETGEFVATLADSRIKRFRAKLAPASVEPYLYSKPPTQETNVMEKIAKDIEILLSSL